MRLRRAARVILIGAPGVGKGTQAERLLERFKDLQSVCTGDILRQNVKSKTPLGIMVENTLKSGGLVADDLILRLISNEFHTRGWLAGKDTATIYTPSSSAKDSTDPSPLEARSVLEAVVADLRQAGCVPKASDEPSASFILDGFPRTANQAQNLDRLMPINLAILIKAPFNVILQRIAARWIHPPSGRTYNTDFHAPKVPGRDDLTGQPLVQRPDDSVEIYQTRYRNFEQTSKPLIEHYAKKGVLMQVEGSRSDDITPKLWAEFERRFVR